MTEFLIYQGKAAAILAVFYMFYRLLLSKDTFHRFNRIILLCTAALSLVLPLCVITIHKVVTVPAAQPAPQVFDSATIGTMSAVAEVSEPIWPYVLCAIFALGASGVLVMTIISIAKVNGIIRKGEHRTLESGETLVIYEAEIAPFSWMKYIVLSREDYESGYPQILAHEKAHIAFRHSWDILFVDMVTALQWFNPAIWMLKADLRTIHEFEADDAVLRSGADVKEYQYLLIRKVVGKSGYSVANNFNHSTLKTRITMMLNKKSSRMSAWKALYVLPLVGISLAATAETKVDYRYEPQEPLKARIVEVHDTADAKVIEISNQSQIQIQIVDTFTVIGPDVQYIAADGSSGEAQPLYVIDGQVMSEDYNLNTIDPEDIESVSVLKDGKQTEVYGERAKDGIICITLKKKEEEQPIRFIHVSEPVGNLEEYSGFVLYSAAEFGKRISFEEYKEIPDDALSYLYVQHLDNGEKCLHAYTVDYNSIVHLRKCRKTADVNDEKLAGVNEETVILVDGKWDNCEGYLRALKFRSDKIKEIEYCLDRDKKSISMISVIFDREYDEEEFTIRNR